MMPIRSRLKRVAKAVYALVQGVPQVTYDELAPAEIRRLVGRPDPNILELGCNDGGHTERFLEVFDRPTIYCFEPDPRACDRFRVRIGHRPNVHLIHAAVSDRVGEITFYQSAGHPRPGFAGEWDLSGSIHRPTGHLVSEPLVTFPGTLTVPTIALDAWCAEFNVGPIDFIWMDVQGAEGDVIRGGPQTLDRARFLYTECGDREQYEGQLTTKALLRALPGFAVVTRYPGDILLRNTRVV